MTSDTQRNDTQRVEAFSDGVFAIAITLLILEVRLPPREPDLARAFLEIWPSYLAFFASFATIGVMWVNHHRLFTLIKKCDDALMGLNLLLLLGITFLPFPTWVLAEHLQRPAGIVYGGTLFFTAIVFNVLWRYVVHRHYVADHADVPSITKQYAIGPIAYLAIMVIAVFSAVTALALSAALAVYFALPPSMFRRAT